MIFGVTETYLWKDLKIYKRLLIYRNMTYGRKHKSTGVGAQRHKVPKCFVKGDASKVTRLFNHFSIFINFLPILQKTFCAEHSEKQLKNNASFYLFSKIFKKYFRLRNMLRSCCGLSSIAKTKFACVCRKCFICENHLT